MSEELGVERIDPWQAKVLDDFSNPKKQRIAMQACVGPGKSAVLAWCGWHFLACRGELGEHPKGAAVSITWENLRDNLWAEMAKWRGKSQFLTEAFEWNNHRIFAKDHPETWFMSARSWSKTADPETQGRTLSGLHSKFVLILIDESGDIPMAVANAGEQALSNCSWGKIMQAGNPSSLEGMLHAAATKFRHLWNFHRITGDPDDPNRSPRTDAQWSREQIETYGRENPWVMSTILSLFPPSSINSLMGADEIELAMSRAIKPAAYSWSQKRLGVDVARFGDDRTILFPRHGLVAFPPVTMRNADGPAVASRVALAKDRWEQEIEFVDDTGGFGGSVVDSMRQGGMDPFPVNASSKADDPRYFNKRSEMWFRMSEWTRRGSLPNDPELVRELSAPTYTFQRGRLMIEDKRQIKKRLGFSPDKADALSLTFALVDMPATPTQLRGRPNKVKHDFDPLAEHRK